MDLQDAIEAWRGKRSGIALRILTGILARSPGDVAARDLFNEVLTGAFAEGRRAFEDGRLTVAAHEFAAVVDHGQPREKLRVDLDIILSHLLAHVVEAARAGDLTTARTECALVLAIDPGHVPALITKAYLERLHGDAGIALRYALRAGRAAPRDQDAANQREPAVQRAGECLLEALRERRTAEASALLRLLVHTDDDLALRVAPLLPDGGPRVLERTVLLWLGVRHRTARRYAQALDCFTQASAIAIDPISLQLEAEAQQYLALEHLQASLRAHCSAYLNDVRTYADSGRIFRSLDALMVQSLGVENIDHWTRTQSWGTLLGWRALVGYAEVIGGNPFVEQPPNPFLTPPAAPRGGERRVFDGCTFFNEVEILEIRLRELYDVVDGFVVVEATHTHSGQPKPLVFPEHRERFRPYLDKVAYVVDDEIAGGFSWQREAHQRDHILRGLSSCRDDDLVIVSDVDEILRRDVVARLRSADPAYDTVFRAELDLFFYRLNYRFRRDWHAAGAAPYRIVKRIGTNAVRYLAVMEAGHLIPDAGWHFSWMGDTDRFLAKLTAYAHQEHAAEYAAQAQSAMEEMRRFLAEGGTPPACGPGGSGEGYEVIAVDERYPRLVREERERFARMGWIG